MDSHGNGTLLINHFMEQLTLGDKYGIQVAPEQESLSLVSHDVLSSTFHSISKSTFSDLISGGEGKNGQTFGPNNGPL